MIELPLKLLAVIDGSSGPDHLIPLGQIYGCQLNHGVFAWTGFITIIIMRLVAAATTTVPATTITGGPGGGGGLVTRPLSTSRAMPVMPLPPVIIITPVLAP